jgi:hypothetical protein
MSVSAQVSNNLPRKGFPATLRLALWGAPLLTVVAWLAQEHWRFVPTSVGAKFTEKALLIGVVVGSISAIRATYRLIRTPNARTVESFALAGVNGLLLLACILSVSAALTLRL